MYIQLQRMECMCDKAIIIAQIATNYITLLNSGYEDLIV